MVNTKELPETTTKIIPDDLIYDNILPRFPVKSLTRFKCVSKTWNSIISTPEFVNSHLHFSSLSSPHFLLLSNNSLYTLSYTHRNTLTHLVKLNLPWKFHTIQSVDSCNGLICLHATENKEWSDYFVVFNPITLQLRKINPPYHGHDYPPAMSKLGFDYFPSFDDYKVVVSDLIQIGIWVFSLRAQKWKYFDLPSDHPFNEIEHMEQCTQVFLDSTLYCEFSFGDMMYIIGFSLVDEQFKQVTPFLIPPSLIPHVRYSYLCAFNGCLSIMWSLDFQYDLFVMKRQEGGLSSWEKLFSIPNMSHVIFVDFVINGKCLVVHERYIDLNKCWLPQRWEHELKLVDPSLEAIEDSEGIGFEHKEVDSVHYYVESLVSPFTLK